MAATDKTYRNQRRVDLVFGVSSVLMLGSVVWMFAQDYYRDFKVEQRHFRDVETAVAERTMLSLLPDSEQMAIIEKAEEELEAALVARDQKSETISSQIKKILPKKVRAEADAQALKADFDSEVSLYNIDVEKRNAAIGTAEYSILEKRASDKLAVVNALEKKLIDAQLNVERVSRELSDVQQEEKAAIAAAVNAEDHLKKLTADFDRFAKLTVQKRWKLGDTIRKLPVIDGFASPVRIQQYTLDSLPIDYNFKYVTRYDRCTTCHQGIDRPAFDKKKLEELAEDPSQDLKDRLENARTMLKKRREILKKQEAEFDASELPDISRVAMTAQRIKEFAAHPRLDLFVDANSPHGAEKFGCTICHSGQGSATDFFNASHSPNDAFTRDDWVKTHGWKSNHYWDFPMLPKRFLESSCLKCHHQVTDLLPEGNKVEYRNGKAIDAPGAKVTRGYNLVRDFGCFGCHEISGVKDNRWVGPDLRLEPTPPLDDLSPAERVKALADAANPPGTMRKVGPSLRRIKEKTNEEWVRKWINDPRGFRPSTRMPHFFNLSNNNKEVLQGTGQENFPEASIHAITYYLFRASEMVLEKEKKIEEPKLPADKDDKTRGRQLFTEKGCLACHSHDATAVAAGNMPAVVGEAQFGPDLSRLAAKLGAGDKPSARRWLIQWIKDPNVYHPRTFMPITHLDDRDASDIAAWLLDQPANWTAFDVTDPKDDKTYENLARVYLNKALTRLEVDEMFANGPNAEKLQEALDPLDKKLGEKLDATGKLKIYIGRKSLNQLGCFGCHDIPGFEAVKPIGTPLNDWGKKDAERLAFEDAIAFVKKNYHVVEGQVDEKGHGFPKDDGKEPYEKFFLESLEHHHREGFLYQKLREPRSYDYDRIRAWDERLRMPQFKFARGESKPLEGETPEQAELRAEAESRESIMTFILGLVAEPIPLKYLYDPAPDRMAEVKGRQVLEKFNCAGCHQVRSGIYEFNTNPKMSEGSMRRIVLDELENSYKTVVNSNAFKSDHPFPNHNAWTGQFSVNPDRVKAHAIPFAKDDGETVRIRLTQALRFNKSEDMSALVNDREKKSLNIPAGESLGLPAGEMVFRTEPWGGRFTDLMVPYLVARKVEKLDDDPKARSGLPPPLQREGEKVQPGWLFQFLRNPYPLRPVAILRMPRFNLSEDEAQTLVNYFSAVDKAANQGIGLTYPYFTVPQRDENFFSQHSQQYASQLNKQSLDERVEKLRPIWNRLLKDRVEDVGEELKAAEKALEAAKDADAKKKAAATRDDLKSQLQKLTDEEKQKGGAFAQKLRLDWEKTESYATDGYRLLVNANICLKCHMVGQWGQDPIGPRLDNAGERLRPDWSQRWIASPQRLLVYPVGFHPMSQNFPRDRTEYQDLFVGSAMDQATATRDVLIGLPKAANMPENRYFRPIQGAGQ